MSVENYQSSTGSSLFPGMPCSNLIGSQLVIYFLITWCFKVQREIKHSSPVSVYSVRWVSHLLRSSKPAQQRPGAHSRTSKVIFKSRSSPLQLPCNFSNLTTRLHIIPTLAINKLFILPIGSRCSHCGSTQASGSRTVTAVHGHHSKQLQHHPQRGGGNSTSLSEY